MRPKEERGLIIEVARATNLTPSQVEAIITHALYYIHKIIKAGKFEGIKLPALGTFWVSTFRLKYLNGLIPGRGREGSN